MIQGSVRQGHIQSRRIGAVLVHRVLDILLHLRNVHLFILNGILLHLQHRQRLIHPRIGLLDHFSRGLLDQILAFIQYF